jgi:hypothetical protein
MNFLPTSVSCSTLRAFPALVRCKMLTGVTGSFGVYETWKNYSSLGLSDEVLMALR